MKSEEFKNVKNGYFIHVVAKLWLEPHDPEQKCRNTFDRIFSELKKDAASGVTLGKFTLASIESDEEQNENAIMTNTSREYPGLYTMRFSFIYIFKGDGIMEADDIYLPKIDIHGVQFSGDKYIAHEFPGFELSGYEWLNEHWYSLPLPADFFIDRSLESEHSAIGADSDLPEDFGVFLKGSSQGDFAYDATSTKWESTLDDDVYVNYCCPWNNPNQRLYIKVYYAEDGVISVVLLQASTACNRSDFDKSPRFFCGCGCYFTHSGQKYFNGIWPVKIIRTNSAFDSQPLGKKKAIIRKGLALYLRERDVIDNW